MKVKTAIPLILALAWLASVQACGKYGPPVRISEPDSGAAVTVDSGEEEPTDENGDDS